MSDPVTFDVSYISALVGVAIPLLVGLLTKLDAPSGVKAAANALLSAFAGVATQVVEAGGTFIPGEAVASVVLTWVVSVATYYGLWKPTKTSEVVQVKTANFGVTRHGRISNEAA